MERVCELLATDPDALKVEVASVDAVFALIWLAPKPDLLRASNHVIAARLHEDLAAVLMGRASPHVVHISAGRTAAVVELVPMSGHQNNILEFASICHALLGSHNVAFRDGATTRFALSVRCTVSAAGGAPPRPPGEWTETTVLVDIFLVPMSNFPEICDRYSL